jgi:hypothetical protein
MGRTEVFDLNTDCKRAWVGKAKASTRAKWRSFASAGSSALKKCLTSPALLSRWEKLGRGGTEDETVKPLEGVQRV